MSLEVSIEPSRPVAQRRHLSRPMNRAVAAALAEAIDQLAPERQDYAYWQERKALLVILSEVAS